MLNRVWELCRYSVKATSFAGIYVDGDRERIPYEADALLNQLCHYSVDREFTLARRSHEYLLNHATWPTEWILQSVLIAWYDYLYTGDIRSAEANYSLLKNKTLSALEEEDGLIVVLNNPKVDSALRDSIRLPQNQKLDDIVDWPRGEFTFMPKNISPNVFHYASLELMGKLAGAMGKKADSAAYASQAAVRQRASISIFSIKKAGFTATESVPTMSRFTAICSRSYFRSCRRSTSPVLPIISFRAGWIAAFTRHSSCSMRSTIRVRPMRRSNC